MKNLRAVALLLPLLAAGCTHEFTIMHDEPHVVAVSEERLVAEATALDGGDVRILAFRRVDRKIEQNFWRQKVSAGPTGSGLAAFAETQCTSRLASSVGVDGAPDLSGPGSVMLAGVVLLAIVAWPYFLVLLMCYGVDAIKPFDEQRTTICTVESVRTPTESATIEAASGGERVGLGKQPGAGWVIDAGMVQRLDLSGASAILRDGTLTVTILIPKR